MCSVVFATDLLRKREKKLQPRERSKRYIPFLLLFSVILWELYQTETWTVRGTLRALEKRFMVEIEVLAEPDSTRETMAWVVLAFLASWR